MVAKLRNFHEKYCEKIVHAEENILS